MNRLLLVVGDATPQTIRLALAGTPERIHVVATTVVGPVDWLANADDAGLRRAERRVAQAEDALEGLVEVSGETSGIDPLQAVADALPGFPADDIVVTGAAADIGLDEALMRFGLPVYRVGPPPGLAARVNRQIREITRGRDAGKLVQLIVGFNVAAIVACLALSLLAIFILWLVGAY
ncbi:MAG TPA: hypothetical protein VKR23_06750 [Gaiellaceae bacterium]|nr:hypothetical protein [Gaiellaceae bacterium]